MTTAALKQRLRKASGPGLIALKRNWPPFVVLQIGAACIVAAYSLSPGFHDLMRQLAEAKTQGGLLFAFIAGMLAGSLVPETAKLLAGRLRRVDGAWVKTVAFNAMVYGVVAVQVDIFYWFQTVWFGKGNDAGTLIIKTAVDMSFFAPFISIPTAFAFFDWRAGGWEKARKLFTAEGFIDRIFPALIPCWAFWIPILFCVYSMPPDLQFCLSIVAEAAWSILFIFIATDQHQVEAP